MTDYQDGVLEVERLELAARTAGTADAAVRAVLAADALAASQSDPQAELAARVKALALRLEFSLDFKVAFFATSARLEEAGLKPLRRKAFRRNLAAMAQRVLDDPELRAWRAGADLVPTEAELDADG
jgi:hypothetical protein